MREKRRLPRFEHESARTRVVVLFAHALASEESGFVLVAVAILLLALAGEDGFFFLIFVALFLTAIGEGKRSDDE